MTDIGSAAQTIRDHFSRFDTAYQDNPASSDGLISSKDLQAVVDNKDGRFSKAEQEAAKFLLDNPAQHNFVDVGQGVGRVDDRISMRDLDAVITAVKSGDYTSQLLDTADSGQGDRGRDGISGKNDIAAALKDPGLNPDLRKILEQQQAGVSGPGRQPPDVSAPGEPVGPGKVDPAASVTPQQLQQIVPTLSDAKAAEVAPRLSEAMTEAHINTPQRKAMFIAQVAHESGGFVYNEEIASGAAYENRGDLGNTQPGDGERFKGRGYIQLTGRSNYERAGRDLGLDLVNNPELAAKPENASRIAAWYWSSNNINRIADTGDFTAVTRAINGGTNGIADRQSYYARARDLF